MRLTLLAVGGPKHGEQLPVSGDSSYLRVPVIPSLTVTGATFAPMKYCIHGATVRSKSDGGKHFVSSTRVAELYGLRYNEWESPDGLMGRRHEAGPYCLFPDYWGRYDRSQLPALFDWNLAPTISVATYEKRIVSDRAVWVFVGS